MSILNNSLLLALLLVLITGCDKKEEHLHMHFHSNDVGNSSQETANKSSVEEKKSLQITIKNEHPQLVLRCGTEQSGDELQNKNSSTITDQPQQGYDPTHASVKKWIRSRVGSNQGLGNEILPADMTPDDLKRTLDSLTKTAWWEKDRYPHLVAYEFVAAWVELESNHPTKTDFGGYQLSGLRRAAMAVRHSLPHLTRDRTIRGAIDCTMSNIAQGKENNCPSPYSGTTPPSI